jgi:predicted HD phosphohydrolase
MSVADRSHAITVARRFGAMLPGATREALAAALLHDVGKVASNLGSTARVVATIVGPRGERFRRYHDHEALGIEMCRKAGSAKFTLDLLEGHGPPRQLLALRNADHL